jgi:thymidylate kinase
MPARIPAKLETAESQTRGLNGIRRWIRPTGLCVAILGPDGSGKSSVIEQYVPQMGAFFSGSECFHLRPHLFDGGSGGGVQSPNTDPHGLPARGGLLSAAKVVYLWLDYVFGYLLRIYPLLAGSRLVIFDRYYHDLLVDPRRFRYGGPGWLAWLIAHLIPLPDLVLVLDAPAEILQARKQEVPADESARQADAYQTVTLSVLMRGRATLIDASLPLDEVVQQCTDRTLAVLAERTTRRLEVD